MSSLENDIIKAQTEQALHIAEVTGQGHLVEKAFTDIIEKGKKAEIGEIRTYSGVEWRKVSATGNPNKDWVRVRKTETKPILEEKEKKVEPKAEEFRPPLDLTKVSDENLTEMIKMLGASMKTKSEKIFFENMSFELARRHEAKKIEAPTKIKVEKERQITSKFDDKSYIDTFKVNGVTVATYERGKDYYHSIKGGVPSSIRDTVKPTNKVRWDVAGLKNVLGDKFPKGDWKDTAFRATDGGPDLKWGFAGPTLNATAVKEILESYLTSESKPEAKKVETPKPIEPPKPKEEPKPLKGESALKDTEHSYKEIKRRLEDIGYGPKHRSFQVLDETYKEFQTKAKELIKKNKNEFDLNFKFNAGWYDSGHKASLSGEVGVSGYEIGEKFADEWSEERRKYPHSYDKQRFIAGKIRDIADKHKVKVYGGSSSYSTYGSSVYLPLATGEIS